MHLKGLIPMTALSLAHWLYALITIVVIITMVCRKGIVLPTIVGTFLVAAVYKSSLIEGFMAIFNASLVAARELFHIFLIIALMVALLKALSDTGADRKMIAPIQKVMRNGHLSFLTLIVTTYVLSLFFWPTPAVPLICTLLLPAALKSGMSRMTVAMTVAITGQGMALSSDYMMQAAPALTAKAAGLDTGLVADRGMILSLITGGVALATVWFLFRKNIRQQEHEISSEYEQTQMNAAETFGHAEAPDGQKNETSEKWSRFFSVLVPSTLLVLMGYMFSTKFLSPDQGGLEGGSGAAFIGGVAAILLIVVSLPVWRMNALDKISQHLTGGLIFSFRAMGPVIPVAGFFLLGSSDFSGAILSLSEQQTPSLLFDLVQSAQSHLPQSSSFAAFVMLFVGIITGLDGSGFSGLPLVGGLSGAMAGPHLDGATLAAIGQMGAIWSGGGTIVAWSSLVAIAAFCNVSPIELVRKNFIPVMLGLFVSTLCALLIW